MLKFICMRLAALSAGYAASLESRFVQTTYTSSQSTFIIAGFKKKSTLLCILAAHLTAKLIVIHELVCLIEKRAKCAVLVIG